MVLEWKMNLGFLLKNRFTFSDFDVFKLGNGWALMGAADALSALELFPDLKLSEEYRAGFLKRDRNHSPNSHQKI